MMLKNFLRVRFVQDVATLQMGRFIGIACGLVSSIAYVRFLGLEGYGVYATIMAFAGIFGILTNLGQQATLTTFLAKSYGQKNKEGMQHIAQYYFCTSGLVSLFLLLLAAAAPFLSVALYNNADIGRLARLVFLSSIFEFGYSYVSIILQVTREIRLLTVLENTKIVLQVGLAVALLWLGFGIAGILYSSISVSLVFFLLSYFIHKKYSHRHGLPRTRDILQNRHWRQVWQYTQAGFWIAIDKNIGNLYPTSFLFVLSLLAPAPIIGLLRLAFKLAELPASFALSSISRLAGSVIPTLAGQGIQTLRPTLFKLATHSFLLHFAITGAGMILVPIFLPYVYGPSMSVAAYPFLVIAALHLAYAAHVMMTPLFRLHNKTKIPAAINATGMAIGLALFFFLDSILPETRALYLGLFVFHCISLTAAVPAFKLLSHSTEPIQ